MCYYFFDQRRFTWKEWRYKLLVWFSFNFKPKILVLFLKVESDPSATSHLRAYLLALSRISHKVVSKFRSGVYWKKYDMGRGLVSLQSVWLLKILSEGLAYFQLYFQA